MANLNFEGSLILEKLAQVNLVDKFYEAVDSDDFTTIRRLLFDALVDEKDIETVLRMIEEQF